MINKVEKKTTLGINSGKIFISTVGVIGSLLSIVVVIIYFDFLYVIISVLCLTVVFSIVYIVAMINQLRVARNEYNQLVDEYNTLLDNRDTLQGIVEDKNTEIGNIKTNLRQKDFIINFLLRFLYSSESRHNLDKEELINGLQIENEQVMNFEKERI